MEYGSMAQTISHALWATVLLTNKRTAVATAVAMATAVAWPTAGGVATAVAWPTARLEVFDILRIL
jgi:hypothetical protein